MGIVIAAPDGTLELEVEGTLGKGDHQAHRDNKAETPTDFAGEAGAGYGIRDDRAQPETEGEPD